MSCPNVTYAWTGDYWLFEAPLDGLTAGVRVKLDFVMIFGNKCPKYWMLEYEDDGAWKPARSVETAVVEDGSELSYNMAFVQDAYSVVSQDVALSARRRTAWHVSACAACRESWRREPRRANPRIRACVLSMSTVTERNASLRYRSWSNFNEKCTL